MYMVFVFKSQSLNCRPFTQRVQPVTVILVPCDSVSGGLGLGCEECKYYILRIY